jgi:hypothetical protein
LRHRLVCGLLAGLLLLLPFALVTFAPLTDLPQQTAQIRLLLDAVGNPDSVYDVQWLKPNNLSYAVLGAAWALFGPLAAGKAAMAMIGLLWLGALSVFARRRELPPAAAVLASLFFFHHVMYWGFYGFVLGLPIFLLWLELTRGEPEPGRGAGLMDAAAFLGVALLLFACHALWFAVGGLWLVAWGLLARWPWRLLLRRLLAVAPVALVAGAWFAGLSDTRFDTPPVWRDALERLAPDRLVKALLGGLVSPLEAVVVVAVLLVLVLVWVVGLRVGQGVGQGGDRQLLLAALLLFVLYLVLPDKYSNTILFSQRWLPVAMVLAVLAAPWRALAERVRPALASGLALALLAAFTLHTTTRWIEFERVELAGLGEALEALPESPRVLGLTFLNESRYIWGPPFLQDFAYAQVLRGGELNFSFAHFPSSLVVYADHRRRGPWSVNLEWDPQLVRTADFPHFTHVLLAGGPEIHQRFAAAPFLEPVTGPNPWRLYAVDAGAVPGEAPAQIP